jgi:hypothetical protein
VHFPLEPGRQLPKQRTRTLQLLRLDPPAPSHVLLPRRSRPVSIRLLVPA